MTNDQRVTGKRSDRDRGAAPGRGLSRRALLGGVGAATAAAGVIGAGRTAAATSAAAASDPRAVSYTETDHVRWFYARARM